MQKMLFTHHMSITLNRSPSISTCMVPPCSSTKLLAMARPSPLPSVFLDLSPRTKRSVKSSGAIFSSEADIFFSSIANRSKAPVKQASFPHKLPDTDHRDITPTGYKVIPHCKGKKNRTAIQYYDDERPGSPPESSAENAIHSFIKITTVC